MFLTTPMLQAIMPNAGERIGVFLEPLQRALAAYGVDTKLEVAAFLATIAEESGELRWTREIWGPTKAQLRYEGNANLGNTQAGDGAKYRGRGLIQCTGRFNYTQAQLHLGGPLNSPYVDKPELLEVPDRAAEHAAYFWFDKRLDPIANRGDFRRVTRVVNGGLMNLERREAYYERAKSALGI